MPPELAKLFEELERLTQAAEADLQALSEQFKARMLELASTAGTPEGDRRLAEETARYEKLLEARIAEVQAAIEAKLPPPPDGPPPRPDRPDLDRMLRRTPPGRRGRRPDAGGVPVKPDRPGGLSGGAAAPIESD